jgi:hypothetical protein
VPADSHQLGLSVQLKNSSLLLFEKALDWLGEHLSFPWMPFMFHGFWMDMFVLGYDVSNRLFDYFSGARPIVPMIQKSRAAFILKKGE